MWNDGLTLVVPVVFIVLRAEDEIICKDISRECNNSNAKAREEVSKHHALLKDRMMAPSVSFCPWISEKRKV